MENRKFKSPTCGSMELHEVAIRIINMIQTYPEDKFQITIGTDSQNFDKTKIVLVIALEREGKGGIFFYQVSMIPKLNDIRTKLFTETQMSLECAEALFEEFNELYDETGFDYTKYHFCIHVDAGENGKTKSVIPEIVGWVTSCGYDCVTKPKSYAASCIADKYSK